MIRSIAKRLTFNLAVCLMVYGLIMCFSQYQRIYAGWFAALAGAVYLLMAWANYLKTKGTDLTKLIKRKRPPRVPYYLMSPREKRRRTRIGLNAPRHRADDEFDDIDEADAAQQNGLTLKQQLYARAAAYALSGALLLALSAV